MEYSRVQAGVFRRLEDVLAGYLQKERPLSGLEPELEWVVSGLILVSIGHDNVGHLLRLLCFDHFEHVLLGANACLQFLLGGQQCGVHGGLYFAFLLTIFLNVAFQASFDDDSLLV